MKEPIYLAKIEYKKEIYEVVDKESKNYFKISNKKGSIKVPKTECRLISKKQVGTLSIN